MIRKILSVIFLIIVLVVMIFVCFKFGYNNGEIQENKEKEYIIKNNDIKESNEELRKKGYNLILKDEKENEEKRLLMLDVKLEIEKGSLSNKSIILNNVINNNNYDYGINFKLNYNYYILEKKIEEKWYKVEPIEKETNETKSYYGESLFRFKKGREYQIYKNFSEYTKKGLPSGVYRISFMGKFNFKEYYMMKEFEIK
jgi:hypothetical protein